MRTPYGRECGYFYQDFGRGRSIMECRLLGEGSGWKPDLCRNCPVPGIQLANACTEMVLRGKIASGFFGWGRRVTVSTYCRRSLQADFDPHIGCSECHKVIQGIRPPS